MLKDGMKLFKEFQVGALGTCGFLANNYDALRPKTAKNGKLGGRICHELDIPVIS
jgi:hypothetical protein